MSLLKAVHGSYSLFSTRSLAAKATNASNVIYRMAKKMDKEAIVQLAATQYIVHDEHYKGLGGAAAETTEHYDYMVRDALRHPYTMIAYDREKAIGFSMVTVRHRDKTLDRKEMLGPVPIRTPNFSLMRDIVQHCKAKFWELYPDAKKVWIGEVVYVDPEFRRTKVASTLIKTQYEAFHQLIKSGEDFDGIVAIVTGNSSKRQLNKMGYVQFYEAPSYLYKRADGQTWKSADPLLPYAQAMFLKMEK